MRNIDLYELNNEVDKFVAERDWDQFHSVKNLTMALSVESSELVELFQWMSEEKSNSVKDDPALKAKVQDEVADIFVYLLRILSKTDIDLEEAVKQKLVKNALKYPPHLARGRSNKYDDL